MQTSRFLRTAAVLIAAGITTLLYVSSAKADPLLFSNVTALQNQGTTRVDLFSNPGTTLVGPQLSFLVDITGTLPPGTTNTLLVTYVESGGAPISQSFDIPAFGTIPPPFTQLVTFTSSGAFDVADALLTIDIIGSAPDFVIPSGPNAGQRVDSYSFSFRVAQPVPEPATIALLGAGLLGMTGAVRNRFAAVLRRNRS